MLGLVRSTRYANEPPRLAASTTPAKRVRATTPFQPWDLIVLCSLSRHWCHRFKAR